VALGKVCEEGVLWVPGGFRNASCSSTSGGAVKRVLGGVRRRSERIVFERVGKGWEEGVGRCPEAIRTSRIEACQEGLGKGVLGRCLEAIRTHRVRARREGLGRGCAGGSGGDKSASCSSTSGGAGKRASGLGWEMKFTGWSIDKANICLYH
jgi:hypothetical protein